MHESPPPTAPSIATYSEVRFDGQREFELRADSIRVRGKMFLQSDFESTIPLNSIEPRVVQLRIRHKSFWHGILIATFCFVAYVVLVAGFGLDPIGLSAALVGLPGIAGLCLSMVTARKVEFARFESSAGVAILDVARAGPDKAQFAPFVDRILNQVKDVRSLNPAAPARA